MRVNAPLDRSTRSVAADWVELHALFDESVANVNIRFSERHEYCG